jgi:diguanylate cyclase (GGDEF)-like protein
MPEAELLQEAMALVCAPYGHLDGLLERADALQDRAAGLGLWRIAMFAKLARLDVLSRQQEVSESLRLAQEVLHWAEDVGDRLVASRAHALLALGFWRLGAWSEAVSRGERAMTMLDDSAPLALQTDHTLIMAMLTSLSAGPFDPTLHQRADALARRLGDPVMVVANLNNLAWNYHVLGDIEAAARTVAELRAVADAAGHRLTATVLDTVAMVLLDQGAADEAERLLTDGLAGNAPVTEADGIAVMLLSYSTVKLQGDDPAAALAAVRECQRVISGKQLGETTAFAAKQLASVHAALGDYRAAYEAMLEYTETWSKLRSLQAEAVASVMQVMMDLDEAREESRRYQELAERDALTGMWNRRYLDRLLPALLDEATGTPCRAAIALVDLDHFKRINDRFSHDVGDIVLREVATLLTGHAGPDAFAVRLGGEEFVIVFCGADTDLPGRCEAVRRAVADHPWAGHAPGLVVTASVGASAAVPGDSMSTLLRRADDLLYRSKREGRDRVTTDLLPLPAPA